MIWALILWVQSNGSDSVGVTTLQFSSQALCESAREDYYQATTKAHFQPYGNAICVQTKDK